MRIVMINSLDRGGGAAGMARSLVDGLHRRGHEVAMIVGKKTSDLPWVHEVPVAGSNTALERFLQWCVGRLTGGRGGEARVRQRTRHLLHLVAWRSHLRRWQGREDFELAGSAWALDGLPFAPDVLHVHNLHVFVGWTHFDLRALATRSRGRALVFTLHDAWLLSGHCLHSFGCERWLTGCGACPDLSLYPAVRRDGTAASLRFKADQYSRMKYAVAGICRWITDRARRSALRHGLQRAEVIYNGVDAAFFRPAEARDAGRGALGLGSGERAVAFIADHGRGTPYRDFGFVERLGRAWAATGAGPLTLFEVGGKPGRREDGKVRWVGTGPLDRAGVRQILQGCDALIHPAVADTAPTVAVEAMACGTPVLATEVCGIPEQITHGVEGCLFAPGDVDGALEGLRRLVGDGAEPAAMRVAARRRAETQFGLERMVDEYERLYEAQWRSQRGRPDGPAGR